MRKTLQIINELEKSGVIESYALGGATALLFYTEPALTFDIDVFVFLGGDKKQKALIDLGPLYAALAEKGYRAEKEHILIEGVPVQFIPVYNALIEEAVKKASAEKYEEIDVSVMQLEHLLAIMIDTNRPKDRDRLGKIVDETNIDHGKLSSILKRHTLLEKWEKFLETR